MKRSKLLFLYLPLCAAIGLFSCSDEEGEDKEDEGNSSTSGQVPQLPQPGPSGAGDGGDDESGYRVGLIFTTLHNFSGSIELSLNDSETMTVVASGYDGSIPTRFETELKEGDTYSIEVTENLLSDRASCIASEQSQWPASGTISSDVTVNFVCTDSVGPKQPTSATFSNTDAGSFDVTLSLTGEMWSDTEYAWILASPESLRCDDNNTFQNSTSYTQDELDHNGADSITVRAAGIAGEENIVKLCSQDRNMNVTEVELGTVEIPAYTIFVSKTPVSGDMGGISGANALCQSWAEDAELKGTWKALLSDSNSSALSMDPYGEVDFRDTTGEVVNADGSLFNLEGDTPLESAIEYDEYGDAVGAVNVFTGTKNSGLSTDDNCSDWTSESDSLEGSATITGLPSSGWYIDDHEVSCDTATARIFCFNGHSSP